MFDSLIDYLLQVSGIYGNLHQNHLPQSYTPKKKKIYNKHKHSAEALDNYETSP